MPTADAVAAVSANPRPRAEVLDEAAAAANGLRVTTLMELESWCSDDWPEHEYWRCVVMAAAVDLCGQLFDVNGNYHEAARYLRWRRGFLSDELRQDSSYEGLQAAREHAEDVISDEINLFLSRQFQETHMPRASSAKRTTTPAKKPDQVAELLNQPWHPKSQRPAIPRTSGKLSEDVREKAQGVVIPRSTPEVAARRGLPWVWRCRATTRSLRATRPAWKSLMSRRRQPPR